MSMTTPGVPTRHDRGAVIPPDLYDPAVTALRFLGQVTKRAESRQRWLELFERYRQEHPALATEFERVMVGTLPDGWQETLPRFEPGEEKIDHRHLRARDPRGPGSGR